MSKLMSDRRYLPLDRIVQFELLPLEKRRLIGAYMSEFWSNWGDGLTFDQAIAEAESLSYGVEELEGV